MAIRIGSQLAAWLHAQVVAQVPYQDIQPVLGRQGLDERQARQVYNAALRDPDGFKAGFSRLSASQPEVRHALPQAPSSDQLRAQLRAATAARTAGAFAPVAALDLAAGHGIACDHGEVRVAFHNARPYVVLFHNVLTGDECDALVAGAQPQLRRAAVVDSEQGGTHYDARRSSELTVMARGQTPLLSRLDARIARITGIPVERGESLQVMRYGVGAEYAPHYDYFDVDSPGEAPYLALGGQRVSSLVIYLNDVEAGGETIFPEVGLSVAPMKGSAVYFAYTDAQSRCDPMSFHGGAPVQRGEKWIATRWMRERTVP